METLHDIFLQLMKPAKYLAQWDFPLSKMLETYRLLNKAEDHKFSWGKVGLMVENLVNVYGKQIEFLFYEIQSLSKQQEEKKTHTKEHKRCSKKIDFDDFELIEIETKNSDLKDENVMKRMKLLPKQFIRVEKRLPDILTETIIDVNNDVIGKKYAFRCYQDMTKDGLLTDELTPQDFDISEIRHSLANTHTPPIFSNDSLSENLDDNLFDESGYHTCHDESDNFNGDGNDIHEINDHQIVEINETNYENDKQLEEQSNCKQIEKQISEKRQSKRLKDAESIKNEKNKNWEPIPFDQGIPDKLPKKRKEFKLPCHINLLTKKNKPQKRKLTERKTLTQLLEVEEPPFKKVDINTPTEVFSLFKKEELDEFKKSFDLCLGSYLYDVVPTITMGFDPTFGKRNLPLDSPAYSIDDVVMPLNPDSPQTPDSYNTPPMTPEVFENIDENITMAIHKKRNYDEIVEKKIKDVQKRRKRTVLEENVLQWHETIKPKLAEAEKRSTFNIHNYGSNILSALSANNERNILLSAIVGNQPAAEAARYFLSSLQLANTYNVDIKQTADFSNIELTLLKENRSTAAENFNLPSTTLKTNRHS